MKLSENAQEQLEYLWTLQEEHDAVEPPPSVDFAELAGLGFVELYKSQPRLTEAREKRGRQRHPSPPPGRALDGGCAGHLGRPGGCACLQS